MGRLFVVEVQGRAYACKFCKTQLALIDDLMSRGEYYSWNFRGKTDALRVSWMPDCWLEICNLSSLVFLFKKKHRKRDLCSKYFVFFWKLMFRAKKGNSCLKGRIVDESNAEFCINSHLMSDVEDT